MLKRRSRSPPSPPPPLPPSSPVKPPERCPHCGSPDIRAKGRRLKKLETVRLYHCRACARRFTAGPRALRGKTYPVGEILDAITAYNRGESLEEVSRRLSSRHGHAISPATISRWLSAHPGLTTYRRLRARGRKLFAPAQLIRIIKLYHAQVYEFGYHRAKLAFLRDGTLDDRRKGDARFAPLADFLENVPQTCPHELFKRDDGARASKLPHGFLALDRLTVIQNTNTATDAAALIIPGVASNRDRHARLQRFMLANDSTTIAVEVPVWLGEPDIAALEDKYRITIIPKQPFDPQRPAAGHQPRRAASPDISTSCRSATARSTSSTTSPTRARTSPSPSSRSTPSRSRASFPAFGSLTSNVLGSTKTATTNSSRVSCCRGQQKRFQGCTDPAES